MAGSVPVHSRISGLAIGLFPGIHGAGHSALDRDRSEGAEGDVERRLAFLARAADVLSLAQDHDEALTRVADMVVPELADGCVIELLDGDTLRQVAITTINPGAEEIMRQVLVRTEPGRATPGPRQTVLQSGKHLLIP